MKAEICSLPGVRRITLGVQEDFRGTYLCTYDKAAYAEQGITVDFVEDDYSTSGRHVLRGIHCDSKAWKLITCPHGRIYVVIVNCESDSPHFGKWVSFILTESNGLQILVPPRHGVAHLVLSEKAIFLYKQSERYDPARQQTFRFDDKRFNIWWPVQAPLLSQRDQEGRYVQ